MKLYYSPGACSLADHIALHEAGVPFDLVKVDLKSHKLEDGRDYTEINPKGSVPALQFDDGEVLTENVAVLAYIADHNPAPVPSGPLGRYRLLEMLAFIATELHKAFHPLFAPNSTDAEKKQASATIEKKLKLVANKLRGPYLFGAQPTVADDYLFVMLTWAAKLKVAIPDALEKFAERMRERPAVKLALSHEGLS
jgi:glutathione S-transferase